EECQSYIRVLKHGVCAYPGEANNPDRVIQYSNTERAAFVYQNIMPHLIQALCIPYDRPDVRPEQTFGRSLLADYLSKKSKLFRGFVAFVDRARSERLDPCMGDFGAVLSREGVKELVSELDRIQIPAGSDAREDYENLRSMAKLALDDPDMALTV